MIPPLRSHLHRTWWKLSTLLYGMARAVGCARRVGNLQLPMRLPLNLHVLIAFPFCGMWRTPAWVPQPTPPLIMQWGFQQRIQLMDLHFEKELVIQEVLSDSQPLPAPPPEPPPCTPMCTARWAPVGSPSPFFWMSGETFVHTAKDSVAVIAEGSDSGLSDFSNFSNCGACFSDAELEPPSPCVSIAADACDSQSDGDTVSPVPEEIVARQGPKRRRVEPPVAAVRGKALLMRMAAAERAVNQIRGAVRDRKGRTRMPPHSGSRPPRQGPANPRPFFSTPQKCGSSGTTCGSLRALR